MGNYIDKSDFGLKMSNIRDQKEKNMQKMIFALFSMMNKGSIVITNQKNVPCLTSGKWER